MNRIIKCLVIIVLLLPIITLSTEAQKLEKQELKPSISCSKMSCPDDDPCCNTCSVTAWVLSDDSVTAISVKGDFPSISTNGCGKILGGIIKLDSEGYFDKVTEKFCVVKYTIKKKR